MSVSRQLLLVRHGLPDYRFKVPADELPGPPLSTVGQEQARQATEVLKRFPVARIHTSPLARTVQTAEVIRRGLNIPLAIDSDLKEWHRTENLFTVSQRSTRWLVRWLKGSERAAVVVGHASPLLALLRSALYLPHRGWWKPGRPDELVIDTADGFELSMASVFLLSITPHEITAECLFHPHPRVVHCRGGQRWRCLPRPVFGLGKNGVVRRPNLTMLVGGPPPTLHGLKLSPL
ncbi:MAG: histidine phosphatase family protein [Planctomycetota bacterium]